MLRLKRRWPRTKNGRRAPARRGPSRVLRSVSRLPRPTSRLTRKPARLTAPGLGSARSTRPRSARLVRTRRTPADAAVGPADPLPRAHRSLVRLPAARGSGPEEAEEAEVAEAVAVAVAAAAVAAVGRWRWRRWRRRWRRRWWWRWWWWRWRWWRWWRWWRRWWGRRRWWPSDDELLHAGERGVLRLARPPAAMIVLPTATLEVKERAVIQERHRRPGVPRRVVLGDVVQPVEAWRRVVPPIEYSCPWTTAAHRGTFFAIGMSASWSRAVHVRRRCRSPRLPSVSSGFVRPPATEVAVDHPVVPACAPGSRLVGERLATGRTPRSGPHAVDRRRLEAAVQVDLAVGRVVVGGHLAARSRHRRAGVQVLVAMS